MLTAGIDTAKNKLDLAVHGSPVRLTCDNAPAGWRKLARELGRLGVGRIGIEATGGYERGVVGHLRKAGFSVLVLQPLQTKAFARLHLRRAKNDAIDAALIAACTALIEPPAVLPDHRLADLADNLTFVDQIHEDIARAKVRREHVHEARLLRMLNADIARLEKRATTEIERIAKAIEAHDDLARRLKLVLSVPGIGLKTAIAIIVRMPEIGRITREQAAALAGLAPFDDDSGQHKGQRHIAGGRARLRRALYAAALPAAFRWNTALIQLYKRLIARGKKHQQALVACARKLIVYANAVVQRDATWAPADNQT
jgi:transposase